MIGFMIFTKEKHYSELTCTVNFAIIVFYIVALLLTNTYLIIRIILETKCVALSAKSLFIYIEKFTSIILLFIFIQTKKSYMEHIRILLNNIKLNSVDIYFSREMCTTYTRFYFFHFPQMHPISPEHI